MTVPSSVERPTSPVLDVGRVSERPRVEPGEFRQALGTFASGVVVVSTVHEGVDQAMTASSFCSVSLDPPLVLVAADSRSRFAAAATAAGAWSASVLSSDQREEAIWFARPDRPSAGQFDGFAHTRGSSSGACLLSAAIAHIECRHWSRQEAGDHVLLVGQVTALNLAGGDLAPLTYYRSTLGALTAPPDPRVA